MVRTRSGTRGFTLVELLVAIGIASVLFAILLPAVQAVRHAAQKADCGNRVRQIAIGVQQYEGSIGHLPIGCRSMGDTEWPARTWLAEILPFIEENALAEESLVGYRAGISPFKHAAHQTPVRLFGCPSDHRVAAPQWTRGLLLVALTSYIGVAGLDRRTPNGVLIFGRAVRTEGIQDGLGQTLLLGERPPSPDNFCGWWYAGFGQDGTGNPDMIMGVRETNLQRQIGVDCPPGPYCFRKGQFAEMCDVFHYWSPHQGGAHFAFCDGSVHFISYDAEGLFPSLASRAEHDVVGEFAR